MQDEGGAVRRYILPIFWHPPNELHDVEYASLRCRGHSCIAASERCPPKPAIGANLS